jgi:hypothetical protein
MLRFGRHLLLLCFAYVWLGCSLAPATSTPMVLQSPTPAAVSVPPTATPLPVPTHSPTPTPEPEDTGWRALASGVEWRRLWAETGAGRERLHLVRFEPDQVRLRVIYQPAHPRKVSQWASVLTDALVVVNAGYFSPDNRTTGLIISDGIPWGRSYDDFAGMLAVSIDGQVTLRWLRTWPFNPTERLAQAVQSFPVLVKPGGLMGFPPDADEGQRSRRTVVAQDTAGRLVLLVSPEFRFSLHELALWLTESDLELDVALNLDGGTSTGLWINDHETNIDSHVPLPAVIAIEPIDG